MRVLFGFLAAVVGVMPVAAATQATPAYDHDFPDPFVITDGGKYYAYSTQVGSPADRIHVPVISSSDLKSWSRPREALLNHPGWAHAGRTWSPAVVKRGNSFLLYYTTTQNDPELQCISVAQARTPAGPFKDSTRKPLMCQADLGGSIDPYPFVDKDNRLYLLWKNDGNAVRKATALWSRELASDGLAWVDGMLEKNLLDEGHRWHVPIGGPAMVWANGHYLLFYSGRPYNSADSGIGYGICDGPLGACDDKSQSGAWRKTGDGISGPHGPTVFNELTKGKPHMGFSGWKGTAVGYPSGKRALWIRKLKVNGNGQPSL